MPEELPIPKKSLKQLEKENKRSLKNVETKKINKENDVIEVYDLVEIKR